VSPVRRWTTVAIFADTTGYGEAGLKDVVSVLPKWRNGAVTFAHPEDAKRNLIVQRKK
jgi:hypothetical protein